MKTHSDNCERRRTAGFTLVEVMIVVAIIGILAAVAVPSYAKARINSQNATFMANLHTAKTAFIQYSLDNKGRYPPDVTPAIIPIGMTDYLGHFPWTQQTTIGGYWDWDNSQFSAIAGVSVFEPGVPRDQMQLIDQLLDDGNLATGSFRERPQGYIGIIE